MIVYYYFSSIRIFISQKTLTIRSTPKNWGGFSIRLTTFFSTKLLEREKLDDQRDWFKLFNRPTSNGSPFLTVVPGSVPNPFILQLFLCVQCPNLSDVLRRRVYRLNRTLTPPSLTLNSEVDPWKAIGAFEFNGPL